MEQVLNNLFTNSIRYAPAAPIRITLTSDDSDLSLVFQDSGPGIAKDSLETIFQRFERATSHPRISGLGLGLFICREIVEAHGGQITAKSEPGKGAAFILSLPRSQDKIGLTKVSPSGLTHPHSDVLRNEVFT